MSVFWTLQQQCPVPSVNLTAVDNRIAELERHVGKALLVCEALWTLVRERTGLTDAELTARVREVDMTDGHLDQRVRRPPSVCAACKRETPHRYGTCIYCGAELSPTPFAT